MRFLPVAMIVAATAFVAPAFAQGSEACQSPLSQIEQAAAGKADSKEAVKALRLARTGKLLCDAGNDREAKKKFRQAFAAVGIEPDTQLVQR